jgi:hypothetical protein
MQILLFESRPPPHVLEICQASRGKVLPLVSFSLQQLQFRELIGRFVSCILF